jgi:hypothetical protein
VRNRKEIKELDEIEEVNEVEEAKDLIGYGERALARGAEREFTTEGTEATEYGCEVALFRQEGSTRTVGRRVTPPPPCFL